MATLNDITNAASYTGSKELGGYGGYALNIDTKPIQQLAQYTYLYNRSQYEQRQKDADQKVAELAKLTAYDLANARGKDKQAGIKALTDLQKFGAEFAAKGTPKSPQQKIEQQIEYQNKIQDAEKTINSINARGIGYTARKNAILSANTDAALKDQQLKELDEEFDNTDIYTPIGAEPKFDLTIPKVAPPIYKKNDVVIEGANGVVTQSFQGFDIPGNMNASFLEANNLDIPELPANATKEQKNEYNQKLTLRSNNKIWQDSAEILNTAIKDPKYQNDEGQIDFEAIEKDNPILHNTISLIERYNNYAADKKNDVINGYYTDKVGDKVKLVQSIKPQDIFTIDVTKPITPAQVVFLEKFAAAAPDQKEEKYQYTGAAERLRLEQLQQAGQTERTRLQEQGDTDRAKLQLSAKASGGGAGTKEEKSLYPIVKTQEIVDFIGINENPKNFTDLTPAQQAKIKSQVDASQGTTITDLTKATISIKGNKIEVVGTNVTGEDEKEVKISINPDDIAKDYYDEVNKNDAGKEAPERKYFKIEGVTKELPKTEKTSADSGDKSLTDAQYFMKYKKARKK